MALREVTREETSTWHQIGLTMGGEDQAHKGSVHKVDVDEDENENVDGRGEPVGRDAEEAEDIEAVVGDV